MTPLLAMLALVLADPPATTVGMTGRMAGVVLPGPELEVVPVENRKTPVVVRIAAVAPHGTAHRYDLTYYGVEPGTYDLRQFLRRKDGTPADGLPPLRVSVTSVLPPGQVLPHTPEPRPRASLGGYYLVLLGAALAWLVGLLAIVFLGRKRVGVEAAAARPASLADRLRPLVEQGLAGRLRPEDRADLERALLVYWRKRLGLGGIKPAEQFATLRGHAEAGPLLTQLEAWLHRPGAADAVDLTALLAPYRAIPADALDLSAAGGRA
jgi:hypothetical protein